MKTSGSTAKAEWGRNWTLVLAAFVGFSFLSVMTGSLSMFMGPISAEFGWSQTFVSLGFTIAAVVTAALSPFFGILVDRYGSRRIAIPGIILTACFISLFALNDGSHTRWVTLWLVYAVISISVKTTVWTAAVAGVFTAGQGLALGVTLCGTAAAQAILPPLTNWLIDSQGWRAAYIWLGLGWGSVALVLSVLFLFDAHDRRKAAAVNANIAAEPVTFPGLTIAEAWRDRALWRISISTLVIMVLTVGLSLHQINILGEAGVSRTQAALLASVAGVAGIVGKLLTGVLLDRFRPNWVGGLTLVATALSFALLIDGVHSAPLIVIAMLVNGYTQGTKLQINGYLTARYAGMRNFGKIYGFQNSIVALGSGVGPLLAAFAYDQSGSYGPFLIVGAIGSVLCGLLLITLPAYPDWTQQSVATDDKDGAEHH